MLYNINTYLYTQYSTSIEILTRRVYQFISTNTVMNSSYIFNSCIITCDIPCDLDFVLLQSLYDAIIDLIS